MQFTVFAFNAVVFACAVSQLKMTVVQFWTIAQVATAVDGKDSDAGWLTCYQFSM